MKNRQRTACLLPTLPLVAMAFVTKRGRWNPPNRMASRYNQRSRLTATRYQYTVQPLNSTDYINGLLHDFAETSEQLDQRGFEEDLEQQREQLEQLLQETTTLEYTDFGSLENHPSIEYQPTLSVAAETDNTGHQVVQSQDAPELLEQVWKARFLLLGAAALYGTNFSVVKILGDTIPVGLSSTLRFGLAALATLPWLLAPDETESMHEASGKEVETPITDSKSSRWWESPAMAATIAGFEVGAYTSVGYVAQAVGLETTDASKSAFICSLALFVVPILDFLVGKRILPHELIGAAMALAGVGFLEFGGGAELTLSSGDIASLIQPLAFGLGFWRMEHAMRNSPDGANRATAAQLMSVFVASALYCATSIMNGSEPVPSMSQLTGWLTDPMILGALVWTGVVTTAFTVYMETVALKTLSAAETTLIFSTEPLWGAATAAAMMGETFGFDAVMGACLILAGCVFSSVGLDGVFGKKIQDRKDGELEEEVVTSPNSFLQSLLARTGLAGFAGGFVSTLEASGLDDISEDKVGSIIRSVSENIS